MCVLSCSLVSNCLWPRGLLSPWNFPGCHSLLQRISLTQGSNLHLFHVLHWQAHCLPTALPGKPSVIYIYVCIHTHTRAHTHTHTHINITESFCYAAEINATL